MSTDGIVYNEKKKEYYHFNIMHMDHNFDHNHRLLLDIVKLISDKWAGDVIKYAYEDNVPDGEHGTIVYGDPYNRYKNDYTEIEL